jgi:hypothetical protein
MMEELDLDTPVLDVNEADVDVPTEEAAAAESDEPKGPFLSVNERTVYKTADDAIRGYNEAANRIASLSAWEKQAKQWGLSSPAELDAVAKELLELRKAKEDAAKQVQAPKIDPKDTKAVEAQQVREYLKGLGYISKEDQAEALKELRAELDAFKQSGVRSEEQRFQNQESEAQQDLNGYLGAAGIKDDANGTKSAIVGTLIKDWINNSPERIERWSRGGVSAKALIKEGADTMIQMLGWKASATTDAKSAPKPGDPGYSAAKAAAAARNKGKLPAPGTAKADDKKGPPKQRGHINAALHEKAWEMMQSGGE